mmetsp:Transcript_59764/g.159945  ORF Transcript_59764/g.159945 Transcript_59764/m.159945 type:complete len:200 (-) Transcript_59764:2061-2660(-)
MSSTNPPFGLGEAAVAPNSTRDPFFSSVGSGSLRCGRTPTESMLCRRDLARVDTQELRAHIQNTAIATARIVQQVTMIAIGSCVCWVSLGIGGVSSFSSSTIATASPWYSGALPSVPSAGGANASRADTDHPAETAGTSQATAPSATTVAGTTTCSSGFSISDTKHWYWKFVFNNAALTGNTTVIDPRTGAGVPSQKNW